MIRNYIKIAIRNLKRFKGYTAINLLGLALGLTCGILIMLFVLDELSYDKFHDNHARIYKIYTSNNETNGWPIGKLVSEYPEVEAVTYARSASFLEVKHENKSFKENPHFVSPEFLKIFSFDFLAGNPNKALEKPFSVVITKEVALKYFGNTDVVGQTMVMADTLNFEITGVIENVPRQSHIQFNILVSFDTYKNFHSGFSYSDGWGNLNVRNYLLLKENTDVESLKSKISNIYMDNIGDFLKQNGMELYVNLHPLSDIYLSESLGNGFGPKGSRSQLYLVSAIALFVILLACINFINLTTARSVYRAKEVGIRKIVGSSRSALFFQFLSESFVITIIAFLLVALIIDVVLPFFNLFIGRDFFFIDLLQPEIIFGSIALVIFISFISGYYPAIMLSGLKPVETLKGKLTTSHRSAGLRKGLVVFQFVISATLVVGTLLVIEQLKFMRDKDPGFDKEQVVVINGSRVYGDSLKMVTIKDGIKNLASVENVSFTNAFPSMPGWQGQWSIPEGFGKDESISVEYIAVDDEYLSTMGIELIAGRNFDLDRANDIKDGLIINETSIREMRWDTPENAIGKKITSPSRTPEGTVIGVVKDYHQEGFQKKIMPIVMDYAPRFSYLFAVKFITGNTSELVTQLEELWKSHFLDREFTYYFLDENFDNQYKAEERLINILLLFSSLTIIIAVTGLFGLVSFMIVSRTKEIGVRKVLGAGIFDVTKLLSWEFLKLVIIANLIIIPFVWYYGERWLENFAYRTELKPSVFLITLIATIGIALVSVGFQTIKAALKNPVDSLKTE